MKSQPQTGWKRHREYSFSSTSEVFEASEVFETGIPPKNMCATLSDVHHRHGHE